jgi:mRNA-degrading endonuclease RelE of RelBE toxin-antitoxin system
LDQFRALPRTIQKRVQKVLQRLQRWPAVSGVKALSGGLAGYYRIRTGDYRIRFRVETERITVDRIGHRKDVYED